MYRPEHLTAKELVWKELFEKYNKMNKTDRILYVFNPLVLKTGDMLRKKYGAITINNWFYGGSLQYRGLRPFGHGEGAALSAHMFGAALDCNFKDATAEEIREDMRKAGCFKPGFRSNIPQGFECFKYIHRVECTEGGKPISWFHFDIFNAYNDDGSIVQLHV